MVVVVRVGIGVELCRGWCGIVGGVNFGNDVCCVSVD